MALVIYTPLAYMTDKLGLQPHARRKRSSQEDLMEARWLTVGPVQENTWIARQDGADEGAADRSGRRAGQRSRARSSELEHHASRRS